ncbi:MAG: glycosyltransferase family 39 protein [Ruminococcus sp.]|nr:glycosyltransferase family 39 protein [Ruminococcus sp.]
MVIMKKYFSIISGILFTAVIMISAFSLMPEISSELNSHTSGVILTIMLVGVSFLLSAVSCKSEKLSERLIGSDSEKADRIFCILASGLLFMQILFVFCQDFTPRNDLSYVCKGAENLVTGRPLYENIPDIHKHYFAVYPNNHALFSVIYLLYKVEYFFTGNVTNILPTILNIISLNISYMLMYMTAKLIYTPHKAFVCAVRGLMFTPLITYSAFFYTDSMAMPYITGALYLYMKWRTSGKIHYMIPCGMVLAVAYKLKGSTALLIPAVIIDIVFIYRQKRKFIHLGLLMTIFAVFCIIISGVSASIIGVTEYEMERYKFPLIHWIMMSADGRGGYCADDFFYTLSFNGYDRKVTADTERLISKLSGAGISGFFGHLIQKISYTWRDGTYMAGYYNSYSFLKSYCFYIFTGICHFTMLSGKARRCISEKNPSDYEFMLKIMFAGLFAFLMIWETRCRYLVSFFALFALI